MTNKQFIWIIEHSREIERDIASFKKDQPLTFFTNESLLRYISKFKHYFMLSPDLKDKLERKIN